MKILNVKMFECENVFKKYLSWIVIHHRRFNDNDSKVAEFKHILTGQALDQLSNELGQNVLVDVNAVLLLFYDTYRIRKIRTQL